MPHVLRSLYVLICALFAITMPAHAADVTYGGTSLGTLTTCEEIRTSSSTGISGGNAGFEASEEPLCFSGGSLDFCAGGPTSSFSFECAGALLGGGYDLDWPAFDLDPVEPGEPDYTDAEKDAFYSVTTRDTDPDKARGRAGNDTPLFLNAHDVCRMINKTETSSGGSTAKNLPPVYQGVRTEEEWRSIHQSPPGDPNGGPRTYPNNPSIDMIPCCAPIQVQICGETLGSGYAPAGTMVKVFAQHGVAELTCVSNNTWSVTNVVGICDGGGGEGGGGFGGSQTGGYSNPSTGGEISQGDWDGMSAAAQAEATAAGMSPDPSVDATNAQGAAEAAAAEAAAQAQAEAEAAEAAAAEAESESDSDGDSDP